MISADTFRRYMRLVDVLQETARKYNAPSEMIDALPAITAVFFDKEASGTRRTIRTH